MKKEDKLDKAINDMTESITRVCQVYAEQALNSE